MLCDHWCEDQEKQHFLISAVSVLWPLVQMNHRKRRPPPQDLEIGWGYDLYVSGAIWVIC